MAGPLYSSIFGFHVELLRAVKDGIFLRKMRLDRLIPVDGNSENAGIPCNGLVAILVVAGIFFFQVFAASSTAMGQSPAKVKSLTCKYATYLGTGGIPCTVSLTAAAGSSGLTVTLTSNNSEAKVQASVKVAAGAASAAFVAHIVTGLTTETATLMAAGGGATAKFSIKLLGNRYQIGLGASSIAFGGVLLNSPATQSIVVKSVGKEALKISAAKVTGSGFSLKGASIPVTLPPGKSETWDIEFDPTSVGLHIGALTVTSNSVYKGTAIVSLTGTGEQVSYRVELHWNAPAGVSLNIAGYRIFRAIKGKSGYQLLNATLDSATSYTDSTVQSGVTYDYYVESVNSAGLSSIPSSVLAISVP